MFPIREGVQHGACKGTWLYLLNAKADHVCGAPHVFIIRNSQDRKFFPTNQLIRNLNILEYDQSLKLTVSSILFDPFTDSFSQFTLLCTALSGHVRIQRVPKWNTSNNNKLCNDILGNKVFSKEIIP